MTTPHQRYNYRKMLIRCRDAGGYVGGVIKAEEVLGLLDEITKLEAEVERLTSTSVDRLTPGMVAEYGRLDTMWQALVKERDDTRRENLGLRDGLEKAVAMNPRPDVLRWLRDVLGWGDS